MDFSRFSELCFCLLEPAQLRAFPPNRKAMFSPSSLIFGNGGIGADDRLKNFSRLRETGQRLLQTTYFGVLERNQPEAKGQALRLRLGFCRTTGRAGPALCAGRPVTSGRNSV